MKVQDDPLLDPVLNPHVGHSQKSSATNHTWILQQIRNTPICSDPAEAKKAGKKLIGTHDGKFHCDEALACAMLKALPEWKDAAIVRTRNPEALAQCDIVGACLICGRHLPPLPRLIALFPMSNVAQNHHDLPCPFF
jgi:hypothetical protein